MMYKSQGIFNDSLDHNKINTKTLNSKKNTNENL